MRRDEHTFLTAVATQILNRWLPLGALKEDISESQPWLKVTHEYRESTFWYHLLESLRRTGHELFYQHFPWYQNPTIQTKMSLKKWAEAAAVHLLQSDRHGALVILSHHDFFPPLLRIQNRGPHGLTVWGNPSVLKYPLVSLVGSRKASREALRESYVAGRRLAESGIAVVSGGAYGCDIASHEGVLASQQTPAPALVIFANGLGNLYPRGNLPVFRNLFKQGGLLVSERLWDSKPFPSDFATRNRIIAGMSGLTLLMQASLKSGAMITARLALEMGSDLAVMTHPAYDVRAEGSHSLINEGALSFSSIEEVIKILKGVPPSAKSPLADQI
jgi:DNA processing protein